jgi:hypothetical protein
LDNYLNANHLRRWISESKQIDKSLSPAFVPVRLSATVGNTATPADRDRIIGTEISRAGGPEVVEWLVDQAHQCILLLRDLLQ